MKNKEMELGFVNCILMEPDLLDDVMDKVDIENFTDNRRKMYKEIKKQYSKTGKFSKTKFYSKMNEVLIKDTETIFDTSYAMPYEIEEIVDKLNNYKLRRDMKEAFKRCSKINQDQDLSESQVKSKIENIILEVTGDKEKNRAIKTFEDVAQKSFENYTERKSRQEEGKELDIIKTYYPGLDSLMEGFARGHLTVLAGATSSGKTAFAVNIMRNILINSERPVYYISLEMKDTELFDRLLIQEAKINASDYNLGDVTEAQHKNINHKFNKLYNQQALITDKAGLDLNQIKTLVRRANKYFDKKLGLVVIDYLTMIKMEKLDNYKTIGKVVTELRDLGKEQNLPVLLLHQINRKLHDRKGNEPKLSDLRDSGEIEERADEVLFVHRPEYFRKMDDNDQEEAKVQNDVKIIQAKHRTGKTGYRLFTWYPEILRFQDGLEYEKEGAINYLSNEVK
ncbi:MAG: replicative DNA helicase [Bacillota bacterium]